ncbi:hypothetical protein [Nocardia amamiensis]|uniref:hypothetical protein n=1 Tax=Nocardia amamiensis TaxID=404578 RepID=UPI0033C21C49
MDQLAEDDAATLEYGVSGIYHNDTSVDRRVLQCVDDDVSQRRPQLADRIEQIPEVHHYGVEPVGVARYQPANRRQNQRALPCAGFTRHDKCVTARSSGQQGIAEFCREHGAFDPNRRCIIGRYADGRPNGAVGVALRVIQGCLEAIRRSSVITEKSAEVASSDSLVDLYPQ